MDGNDEFDEETRKMVAYAFVPFSLGYRGCAGKTMAYMEIKLTIARALWYFDFKVAPGEKGRLGEGGRDGCEKGRERKSEFQLEDTFTSKHDGPNLVFKKR
jgi:cytochrome P450